MEERIEKICDSINFNSSIPANMINNETLRYIFKKFYPNVTDDFSISEDNLPKIRDKFLRFCSDYPLEFKLVGTIILSLILFIGTIGNLLVIYVIVAIREMHTRTYYFLSSLAMADLLVLLSTIPVEITYFWFKNEFVFGELACRVHIYFAFFSINCSATNIAVVTFERYRAICYPFKTFDHATSEKNEKTKKTKKYIFFIWLFNCVYNLFWFFLTQLKTNPHTTKPTCDYKWNRESYLFFFFFDLIFFYLLPLFLSAYMYAAIYHNLLKSLTFSKTSVDYPDHQVAPRPSNNPTIDYCDESDNQACSSYYSAGPDQNSNYDDCDSRQESSSLAGISPNIASASGHKDSISRKNSARVLNNLGHKSQDSRDSPIKFHPHPQKNGGLGNKIAFTCPTKTYKQTVQEFEPRGECRKTPESESDKNRKKRKVQKIDSIDRLRKESKEPQKNRIVVLLFLIFVLFALLLLPYRGLLVYNSLVEEKILNKWFLLACKSLLSINSMINPILYNLIAKRFRNGFKSALNKFFCFNFKSIRPNTQESYMSSRT